MRSRFCYFIRSLVIVVVFWYVWMEGCADGWMDGCIIERRRPLTTTDTNTMITTGMEDSTTVVALRDIAAGEEVRVVAVSFPSSLEGVACVSTADLFGPSIQFVPCQCSLSHNHGR